MVTYTVPGMKSDHADKVVALLQDRLNSLNDLALTCSSGRRTSWSGSTGSSALTLRPPTAR